MIEFVIIAAAFAMAFRRRKLRPMDATGMIRV
jgi:hypothetical protein